MAYNNGYKSRNTGRNKYMVKITIAIYLLKQSILMMQLLLPYGIRTFNCTLNS
jgi:hypothetical protein